MYHLVNTDKSFAQASADLEATLNRHGFRSLKVYDLGEALRSKGLAFFEQSLIFEVCNPGMSAELSFEACRCGIGICRIAVFTEKGQTKIVLNKQSKAVELLAAESGLIDASIAMENKVARIIDAIK